jgi:cell shape-determining protein MreC
MTNFSLKTKRNSPHNSVKRSVFKIVVVTLVALLLISFLRGVVGDVFSGVTMRISAVKTYFQTSGAALPTYVRERTDLLKEIQSLKEDLAAGSGSKSTIARLVAENEELRALLSDSEEERILAGVVARPPFVPYDLLVLDKGERDGIEVGAPVYVRENHVIGAVSRVFEKNSLVTLFSSAGAETTVYLYGANIFAYAYGEGGGVIRISVPQGIPLKEGDPVVLPSVHASDLGVVDRIVSLPAEPEQNAYVTFPISIQSIRLVSVGKQIIEPKIFSDIAPSVEEVAKRFRVEVPEALRMGTTTPTTTDAVSTTTP